MTDESSKSALKRSRPEEKEDEASRKRREKWEDLLDIQDILSNPTPELTDEDIIKYHAQAFRDHIGIGREEEGSPVVLFFVELAPHSSRGGARCRHPTCVEVIKGGSYRIAVHPGDNVWKSAEYYHMRCFEDFVDFTQAPYLDRVQPCKLVNASLRGVSMSSILDGNYLLDGGAQRLVEEWKFSIGKLIDARDGVPIDPPNAAFDDLLHRAGSASYKPASIEGMTDHVQFLLAHSLAPIESDGVDDEEEWDLFAQHLGTLDDLGKLNEDFRLSDVLKKWKVSTFLARADDSRLTTKGKEAKGKLSPKAIRAYKRLASIHM
ncbi:hypothetical protein FB567DRAFT_517137 [Paraphoma chrysanthemicola]|uniref:PARP-type domain-containing protein n=1 Tax=Paraphoma chrysanthemicola TaxID=798071 RepID=A0A8K0W2V1_9PLEO|nr:hypothetical protein FB567DRAFT_517137 [Paraphoma chrysanthemicola]